MRVVSSSQPLAGSGASACSARDTRQWLAWAYAPAVLLLVAIALGAALRGLDPAWFTRDPAAWHEAHPLIGSVSNLGVLLWAAAAAISLFAAAMLRISGGRRERRALLLHAGLLTLWLTLDDLFMFHERLAPDELGIPQRLVFLGYAAWFAAVLLRFRALLLQTRGLLLPALAFFAVSAVLDQFAPAAWFEWRYLMLVEDGAKFLGIVSWFACLTTQASAALAADGRRCSESR